MKVRTGRDGKGETGKKEEAGEIKGKGGEGEKERGKKKERGEEKDQTRGGARYPIPPGGGKTCNFSWYPVGTAVWGRKKGRGPQDVCEPGIGPANRMQIYIQHIIKRKKKKTVGKWGAY